MKVKRWIGNIISVVIVAMLLFAIFFLFSSKITGGKPKIFGYELMTVLSGSMEPNIKTGSIIAVKPISAPEKCKVGEVVTYQSLDDPNTLITHRIIKVEKSGSNVQYVTKGDNNESEDLKPVPASHIVGTYANFTVPAFGYLFNFVRTKIGTIILIIIPSLIIGISEVIELLKYLRKTNINNQDNNHVGEV